jgi:hypothetical protein
VHQIGQQALIMLMQKQANEPGSMNTHVKMYEKGKEWFLLSFSGPRAALVAVVFVISYFD